MIMIMVMIMMIMIMEKIMMMMITSGDPAISDHALPVIFIMSRTTGNRIHIPHSSTLTAGACR